MSIEMSPNKQKLFRVKPKTEWKRMPDDILSHLADDGLRDGDGVITFPEGFDGIDELTDYELIGVRPDSDGQSGADVDDDDDDNEDDDDDEVGRRDQRVFQSSPVKRTRKRKRDDVPVQTVACPQKKKKTMKAVAKFNKGNEAKKRPVYDSTTTTPPSYLAKKSVDTSAWDGLYVPDPVLMALVDLGFDHPTQIQALTLPPAIRDRMDILGAAETGSGKTLAFGIPIINHILTDKENEGRPTENTTTTTTTDSKLRCLVVTPTRELAIQVKNHLIAIAKYTDIKITVIVGGMSQEKQLRILKRCPDIVVGTPGRLWELIHEGHNHLGKAASINYLVIDEADRMLEKGHFEELSRLLAHINFDGTKREARQNFVFSATLTLIHDAPKRILTNKKKPKLTEKTKLEGLMAAIGIKEKRKVVDITRKVGTVETLREGQINCKTDEKDAYLYYILTQHPGRTLVFCNSVDCVRRLTNVMSLLRLTNWPLHALMHQKQRLKNLERFVDSESGVLVATDVAQRGLDVPNVKHVVHYQVPRTSEAYVHRSGRTARASKEGVSIMFIDADEAVNYRKICRTLKRENDLPVFPVNASVLKEVKQRVKLAQTLDQLEHRHKRLSSQNNWFKKAAMDMDIELDEDDLLNNMGNRSEQADHRRQVKSLRQQLDARLCRPILGERIVPRYPSGFGTDLGGVLQRATVSGKDDAVTALKREQKKPRFDETKGKRKFKRKSEGKPIFE